MGQPARAAGRPRSLRLRETLRERPRPPLITEDADTVDGALKHGVRKRGNLRSLDEEHRVLLRRELVHDLALIELPLDGLLVVGFHDDPRHRLLHGRTPLLHSPNTFPTAPEATLRRG